MTSKDFQTYVIESLTTIKADSAVTATKLSAIGTHLAQLNGKVAKQEAERSSSSWLCRNMRPPGVQAKLTKIA
jgi:hypothetical protein